MQVEQCDLAFAWQMRQERSPVFAGASDVEDLHGLWKRGEHPQEAFGALPSHPGCKRIRICVVDDSVKKGIRIRLLKGENGDATISSTGIYRIARKVSNDIEI